MFGIAETTFFPKEGTRKVKEKKKKNEAQPLAYLRVGCKWVLFSKKIVQRDRVLFGLCFVFVPRVIVRLVLCDSSVSGLDHCGWGWDEGNFEFSK